MEDTHHPLREVAQIEDEARAISFCWTLKHMCFPTSLTQPDLDMLFHNPFLQRTLTHSVHM